MEQVVLPARKKRVPKACEQCRRSKLKCDQKRPCSRCAGYGCECLYVEAVRDANEERLENLENELSSLRSRLASIDGTAQAVWYAPSPRVEASPQHRTSGVSENFGDVIPASPSVAAALSSAAWIAPDPPPWSPSSEMPAANGFVQGQKRKWQDFKLSAPTTNDFVARGLVTEEEARSWFACFFSGCDRFVPAFSPEHDSYASVRSRSSLLFDTIVAFGSRAAQGHLSPSFQHLHALLRERVCNLLVDSSGSKTGGLEAIQALLIHACYGDDAWLLISLAIRLSLTLDLPNSVGDLLGIVMARKSRGSQEVARRERELFRAARVWCALFNLEQILSLDGGKPPLVQFTTSPRRLRMLCTHPFCTTTDLRLFAQVELNVMRVSTYASLASIGASPELGSIETGIESTVQGASIDLDLWLEEWAALSRKATVAWTDNTLHDLNLRIQHAYASLTLNLRALSASGIENIAAMTESQQGLARAAYEAAERHLKLALTRTGMPQPSVSGHDQSQHTSDKAYLASFRYALRFVWAKCAFSVLLVLRLAMLLKDPIESILEHIADARELLAELERVGGNEVRYTKILSKSVEKCEKALREMQNQQRHNRASQQGLLGTTLAAASPAGLDAEMHNATSTMKSAGNESVAEQDFQTYVPQEFLFEWAFPGLTLYYVPLDWQDLFVDFGALF